MDRRDGAYMRPRPINPHKPALTRSAICTFQRRTMGKRASRKSEIIEIKACEMMILDSCALVKHFLGICVLHELEIGLHWNIHNRVRMILLIIRQTIVP